MSSEIPDSFNPGGDDDSALSTGWTRPFNDDDDDDGGGGDSDYDSVPHDSESRRDYNLDSPIFRGSTGVTSVPLAQYPPSAYGEPISKRPDGSDSATDSQSRIINGSGEQVPFAQYPPSAYGEPLTKGSDGSDGPILSPTSEMGREEGFALREWRRENAIRLQEKEKREKELLNQIIEEADEYKLEFYQKIKIASENNKASNREKQKLFLANQEKFHAEANKNYWRSITELIPNEVPTIEKKRGKKDQEKKPSIVVIQGPKPGKPTDLSRMRQILVKLKHNTPAHLKHAPPPPAAPASDTKSTAASAAAGTSAAAPPKAVAVA